MPASGRITGDKFQAKIYENIATAGRKQKGKEPADRMQLAGPHIDRAAANSSNNYSHMDNTLFPRVRLGSLVALKAGHNTVKSPFQDPPVLELTRQQDERGGNFHRKEPNVKDEESVRILQSAAPPVDPSSRIRRGSPRRPTPPPKSRRRWKSALAVLGAFVLWMYSGPSITTLGGMAGEASSAAGRACSGVTTKLFGGREIIRPIMAPAANTTANSETLPTIPAPLSAKQQQYKGRLIHLLDRVQPIQSDAVSVQETCEPFVRDSETLARLVKNASAAVQLLENDLRLTSSELSPLANNMTPDNDKSKTNVYLGAVKPPHKIDPQTAIKSKTEIQLVKLVNDMQSTLAVLLPDIWPKYVTEMVWAGSTREEDEKQREACLKMVEKMGEGVNGALGVAVGNKGSSLIAKAARTVFTMAAKTTVRVK